MTEYKVVNVLNMLDESIEAKLNELADDDWVVVCAIGDRAIIVERNIDEGKMLAEEVLRRQFTYSIPGMEDADV